ncbi:MAG: protein kinase, partial [Thermoanaerobaculia bacterium]
MRPDERESWVRADRLLAELLDLPAEERAARLARLALAPDVERRLAALLAAAKREDGPLDRAPEWPASPVETPPPMEGAMKGRRFGAYEIDSEIGRGGMAVVYLGHRVDGAFAQEVAVKVLGTGLLPTSAAARFQREQGLLARLRHPRIATLLDGGLSTDGTPYLVMERIDGRPIDRYCTERGCRRRIVPPEDADRTAVEARIEIAIGCRKGRGRKAGRADQAEESARQESESHVGKNGNRP